MKNKKNILVKKYLFTGLIILLPFTLTILIVTFLVSLLTKPFQDFAKDLLNHSSILPNSFLFLTSDQILFISSQILILIALILFITMIGFLGQLVLVRTTLRLGELLIHKIPFINKIYRASKEVVKSFLNPERKTFSQVVLVPFPHSKVLTFGFLSGGDETSSNDVMSIFIPTTPNPTIGYTLIFKKNQLIFLDIQVEEVLKSIISCGIIFPNIRPLA